MPTCRPCEDLHANDPGFPPVREAPPYIRHELPELPPNGSRPGSRLDKLRRSRYGGKP